MRSKRLMASIALAVTVSASFAMSAVSVGGVVSAATGAHTTVSASTSLPSLVRLGAGGGL